MLESARKAIEVTDRLRETRKKFTADLLDIMRPVDAREFPNPYDITDGYSIYSDRPQLDRRTTNIAVPDVAIQPCCNFCSRPFETLAEVHEHERFTGHGQE